MSAPFAPPGALEDGCSWCGPGCARCWSEDARERHRRAVLIGPFGADGGRVGSEVLDARWRDRPNRHDDRRRAQGDYLRVRYLDDVDGFVSVEQTDTEAYFSWSTGGEMRDVSTPCSMASIPRPLRGRRVRDAGAEWALMCRRVRGVIEGIRRWQNEQQLGELAADQGDLWRQRARHRNAVRGGRKTRLAAAVAAGGWRPAADDPLAPTVAALTLRLAHWRRRKRRWRRG